MTDEPVYFSAEEVNTRTNAKLFLSLKKHPLVGNPEFDAKLVELASHLGDPPAEFYEAFYWVWSTDQLRLDLERLLRNGTITDSSTFEEGALALALDTATGGKLLFKIMPTDPKK